MELETRKNGRIKFLQRRRVKIGIKEDYGVDISTGFKSR